MKNRVKLGLCELCGKKTNDITSFHQVKRMKDLTGNLAWELQIISSSNKINDEPDTRRHVRTVLGGRAVVASPRTA
ncbi:MAG: hypothetical protein LBJ12_01885 [Oscillospiraceae bacterium]|nr:hypothetical protein [Oscillospiraceae bacterium]